MGQDSAASSIDGLRYNQVRQKSTHNAYKRIEGLIDQLVYWRIRSLEVDLHMGDQLGRPIDDGDWAVYHATPDPMSSVPRMSQVLEILAGFHRAVPDHEVITVFVDMKDAFPVDQNDGHSGLSLDRLIIDRLDAPLGGVVYRPHELLNRDADATSLKAAVAGSSGWPTLAELRGRFIFCITGGPSFVEHYTDGPLTDPARLVFVSVPVAEVDDIPGDPDRVFFNVDGNKHIDLARQAACNGWVARAYYVNDRTTWRSASDAGVHRRRSRKDLHAVEIGRQ